MSQEDFYMGGRETSMFPGLGQKRKCLSDTGVCVKFSNPVLITKLPIFFNCFYIEWKPNISICVLISFSHQKTILQETGQETKNQTCALIDD